MLPLLFLLGVLERGREVILIVDMGGQRLRLFVRRYEQGALVLLFVT